MLSDRDWRVEVYGSVIHELNSLASGCNFYSKKFDFVAIFIPTGYWMAYT